MHRVIVLFIAKYLPIEPAFTLSKLKCNPCKKECKRDEEKVTKEQEYKFSCNEHLLDSWVGVKYISDSVKILPLERKVL